MVRVLCSTVIIEGCRELYMMIVVPCIVQPTTKKQFLRNLNLVTRKPSWPCAHVTCLERVYGDH